MSWGPTATFPCSDQQVPNLCDRESSCSLITDHLLWHDPTREICPNQSNTRHVGSRRVTIGRSVHLTTQERTVCNVVTRSTSMRENLCSEVLVCGLPHRVH